MSFAGEEVI